jgi:hypothetical protein
MLLSGHSVIGCRATTGQGELRESVGYPLSTVQSSSHTSSEQRSLWPGALKQSRRGIPENGDP